MKKTNGSQQYVSKGNFGHDLSNSFSNMSLERGHGKKGEKSGVEANVYVHKLSESVPQTDVLYKRAAGGGGGSVTLPAPAMQDSETYNDADDEKDTGSNTGSESVSAESELGSSDVGERSSIPIRSLPEFEKIAKSLLRQIKASRSEAKQNRDLAQQLSNDLATATQSSAGRKASAASDSLQNFENIISFYGKKFEDMDRASKENVSRMVELEDTFNNIQRFQSSVYQNHLKELDTQISEKNRELHELRRDYQQLEQWVLALFKEVGDRAKSWSNHEFVLTTNEISKSLKPPVKKSNLEMLYRYLVQFLYLEEAEEGSG